MAVEFVTSFHLDIIQPPWIRNHLELLPFVSGGKQLSVKPKEGINVLLGGVSLSERTAHNVSVAP